MTSRCRNEACLGTFEPQRHTQFYCSPGCRATAERRRERKAANVKYRGNAEYRAEHKARVLRLTEHKAEEVRAIARVMHDVKVLAEPRRVGLHTLERTRAALEMLRDFLVEASQRDWESA